MATTTPVNVAVYSVEFRRNVGWMAVEAKRKAGVTFAQIDARASRPYGWSMGLVNQLLCGDGSRAGVRMIGELFFCIDGSVLNFSMEGR